MTESELRQKVVDTAKSYIGATMGSDKHHELIDIYNSHKPLARGVKMSYSMAWCSATVSAIAIKCKVTAIIPTEVSCGRHIDLFKQLDEWEERDSYKPKPGDLILYDWDDDGKGDNEGWPDHIGIVEKVNGSNIHVIEGNMGNPSHVGRRVIAVDSKYIRGYGVPKYYKLASKTASSSSGKRTPKLVNVQMYDVKLGDTHRTARALARELRARGWLRNDKKIVDGFVFDKECEQALRNFQKATHKLKVDGWAGAKTLYWVYNKGIPKK